MRPRGQLWWWLGLGAIGLALVALYPDCYQQDAGYHYLFARYAWRHPALFVGVWSRPIFTLLYALPAQLGYPVAKLTTFVICLLVARETFALARSYRLERAPLVIALLFLEPSFLMISGDTMTEPIFALIFVIALRQHLAGRTARGMWTASLLPLARPEGFFLGILWGVWILVDSRDPRAWWPRIPGTLRLLGGCGLWWLAAWLITGDPFYIRHNWPSNWGVGAAWYGIGPAWTYLARLPEIAGPLLLVPFVAGLAQSILRRRMRFAASAVLLLFVVHTVLRVSGWFGSAGYARYFVCVSPAIALLTLAGWNDIAQRFTSISLRARRLAAATTIGASAIVCVLYVDMAGFYGRDARAVADMAGWLRAHPRPVHRVIWSQAYMCVRLDRDPLERPEFSGNKAADVEMVRASEPGTLVFWDDETGPAWYGLTVADFETAGFERLGSREYQLDGWLREASWLPWFQARRQRMTLLYK